MIVAPNKYQTPASPSTSQAKANNENPMILAMISIMPGIMAQT